MAKPYPAGPGDNSAPIEWPAPHSHVTLRGGERGRYFGRCPITERHRMGVPSARHSTPEKPVYDIWLLDDMGRCRCSPGPSQWDYLPHQQPTESASS